MEVDYTLVSTPINLQQFLEEWKFATVPYDINPQKSAEFERFASTEMGMTGDMIRELDLECRPSSLACPNEPSTVVSLLSDTHDVPDDVDLATVNNHKSELERRQRDPVYRRKTLDLMKYHNHDGPWKHQLVRNEPTNDVKVETPDIILSVQIYRPYSRKKVLLVEQEFDVLGQQKLTELRDMISCLADYAAVGNFSSMPDMPRDVVTKDVCKSGFIWIEGVFYNDMRDQAARDYSAVITEWAKEPMRGLGPYHKADMEMTRFIDLKPRLGQPYLYIHQGDCEHMIVFSDLRLLHSDDCQLLDKYPILTYRSRDRKPTCRVCQKDLARWLTFNSSLAPEDPCFFCDTCFRALHYDEEGKLIQSGARVYPYPERDKLHS